MHTLFGQAVFSVAGRVYGWEDVVLAAKLWGDWDAVEARTRQGLESLARLRSGDETLDEGALDAEANAFRYDHNLISGEETKAWLTRWGMTVGQWKDYLRWTMLRDRSTFGAAHARDEDRTGAVVPPTSVMIEAVCSGDLARLAHKLAGHAAVAARARHDAVEVGAATGAWDARFHTVIDPPPEEWPGVARAALREMIENFAQVERRFEAMLPQIVTAKAVAEQIRLNYFDWIQLDVEAASFPDEGMAREAALGVREDGMSLAEVAAELRFPVRRGVWQIEAIDPALRGTLLAASPGELVGPFLLDDEYCLVVLHEKIVPTPENQETAKRADVATLDAALTREMNERVRWRWPL